VQQRQTVPVEPGVAAKDAPFVAGGEEAGAVAHAEHQEPVVAAAALAVVGGDVDTVGGGPWGAEAVRLVDDHPSGVPLGPDHGDGLGDAEDVLDKGRRATVVGGRRVAVDIVPLPQRP